MPDINTEFDILGGTVMPGAGPFTNIVFGSATGGKILAWTLAEEGQPRGATGKRGLIRGQ